MSHEPCWSAVDAFFGERLVAEDEPLRAARQAAWQAGLPAHEVAPNQGKLLYLLARAIGARRVLEVGTLAGYSTIWLARAVGPGGRVVTIEVDPLAAGIAARNVDRAGLSPVVTVHTGPASERLRMLEGPFDLVFLDADKQGNPGYLAHALRVARAGALLVADNVVRGGAVADPDATDPAVRGVQAFTDLVAAEPRLEATALQTVGAKGHDGFLLALVLGQPRP